jgi:hypothetical protein
VDGADTGADVVGVKVGAGACMTGTLATTIGMATGAGAGGGGWGEDWVVTAAGCDGWNGSGVVLAGAGVLPSFPFGPAK